MTRGPPSRTTSSSIETSSRLAPSSATTVSTGRTFPTDAPTSALLEILNRSSGRYAPPDPIHRSQAFLLAGIGTAVVLYPVLKRQNQAAALGLVGARVLESATIFAGIVILMSMVTLRQAGAGAGALTTGTALVALHNWTFLVGQGFIPGVCALLLGTLLYRSRL